MRTLSLDIRERILASYDNDEGTRAEIGHRFRVSLGMVKKLLQQRRRTGDIAPRHRFAGRKPMIIGTHRSQMRSLLTKKNDLTLKELRAVMGLRCSLQAIHVVLEKMGMTYKKRRSAPVSKVVQTSPGSAAAGGSGKRASTRPS
jgi:transposase